MSVAAGIRPLFERTDVSSVLVEEVITGDERRQHDAVTALVKHWEAARWPEGLCSLTCFTSSDGNSILTYAQWYTDGALEEYLRHGEGITRPDWAALQVQPGQPAVYRLYRVVRPIELPDPVPVAECFPAATFPMESYDAARKWVDGLLDSEEENEGQERAYPGAIAANFHIAADGTGIFLLSEWASETEAVAHIIAVIEPLLEHMGSGADSAGSRYRYHWGRTAAY